MLHRDPFFLVGSILAGIGALTGGVVIVRRARLMAHAPSAMPPDTAGGALVAAAPAAGLTYDVHLTFQAALQKAMARRKIAFYKLEPREQELVVAAVDIRDSLASYVAEMELSWATWGKVRAQEQMQAAAYWKFEAYHLTRWPLLLDSRARVFLLEITKAAVQAPASRVVIQHDIQIPPAHLPPPLHVWHWYGGFLSASAETASKPAEWWAEVVHDQIREAREQRTGKPWDPVLDTAPMPARWILDAGRALASALGSGDEVAEVAQSAATEATLGAERVIGPGWSVAAVKAKRLEVLGVITKIVALCEFWLSFRWW